jgi:multidrug efflux system outer membrane protein
MIRRVPALLTITMAVSLTGCLVGPNYHRPKLDIPPAYRGPAPAPADQTAGASVQSLGDAKWWTVFQDDELQKLIRTALAQNYNLRIAASRVLQAEAQVTATRSNQFPQLSGGPQVNGTRTPQLGNFQALKYNVLSVMLSASWDLDFWGKYRRATEEARANLVATEWGRRAVISSLVASVAADYFQLRALDLQLEIAKRTLTSRQESLKLTETLANGGSAALTDVRQAQQLVETAAEEIPDLERLAQLQENTISILLGRNPGPIARGRALTEEPLPPSIPAGVPSALIERRPDIQEAEQQLVAANAQIGVAKAAYFPDISLTGTGGFESASLSNLFSVATHTWTYAASASEPIFTAGRVRADVRIAQAQQQQALFAYQQTIQQAFSDVSNSLIGYEKYREFRGHQELLTSAAQDASNLSHARYQGGVTSYLEVLTNETNYFAAELNLVQARLNERLSLVQIYNALGGGWQQ